MRNASHNPGIIIQYMPHGVEARHAMPRPKKWDNEQDRRQAQNALRTATRASHRTKFVAVDGEGTGSGKDHRYVLLGVGERQISDNSGLQFPAIASFLYSAYLSDPGSAFVGFYLGYDFTQWFKTLPVGRAWYLLSPEGIAKRARRIHGHLGPFPVKYEGWEFDILGMKRMRLRPEGEKGWMSICDAGPFFQTSFLNVLNPKDWNDPIVTPDEYATILEGKSQRDTAILDDSMCRYNRLENTVMARLMHRLNVGFVATGIRLKKDQWFGPGQAAQAWLSGTELPSTEILQGMSGVPWDIGRLTYYGGWFEIFAHGHIPGTSYEYDINSAYPYIASSLPCLQHRRWTKGNGIPGELGRDAIRIIYAEVRGTDKHLGAMLHRTPEGSIRRPSATRGYYWQSEIDAAQRCGAIGTIRYLEWWEYDPCDCPSPLSGLTDLYNDRLAVGKNTPEGKARKLVYNSVYGKLAQSVGSPKYGNALYASLITSGCRTMILNAIATHPLKTAGLLMVATDGVYFTTEHPGLPVSDRIGEWDVSEKDNLTLFKPGVYWDDRARQNIYAGENPSFKARGINAREFARHIATIDLAFAEWPESYPEERDPEGSREGWHPRVVVNSGFSMVTCQQALQRRKWQLAGTLGHESNEGCAGCDGAHLIQDADPVLKRHSGWKQDGIYWSRPYPDGGEVFESTPYDKRFGMPDPDEYGITDDGTVLDTWKGCYQP